MITAKEYFEKFISWRRRHTGEGPDYVRDSYSAMDLTMLQHDADMGSVGAVEELGVRTVFGNGVKTDVEAGEKLLLEAAEAGHPEAFHVIAEIYHTNEFGRRDPAKYRENLLRAADAGCWMSLFDLAVNSYTGNLPAGILQNKEDTIRYGLACADMTRGLIENYYANSCTEGLQRYYEQVYECYFRSITAVCKQLVKGDGVAADVDRARAIAQDAESFHENTFHTQCPQFLSILRLCGQEQ